ncbi:MAG: hypothetical protein AB8B95_07250 [Pseudohongiellaceae bacterium]
MYKLLTCTTADFTSAITSCERWTGQISIFASLLLLSGPISAASSLGQAGGSSVWNWIIAAIVFSATIASGVLCLAAYRNWQHKGWRAASLFPLFLLGLLLVMISLSQFAGKDSHTLWPLEVFAWSMFNMIYMVGIMTTKRIFEKADGIQG